MKIAVHINITIYIIHIDYTEIGRKNVVTGTKCSQVKRNES